MISAEDFEAVDQGRALHVRCHGEVHELRLIPEVRVTDHGRDDSSPCTEIIHAWEEALNSPAGTIRLLFPPRPDVLEVWQRRRDLQRNTHFLDRAPRYVAALAQLPDQALVRMANTLSEIGCSGARAEETLQALREWVKEWSAEAAARIGHRADPPRLDVVVDDASSSLELIRDKAGYALRVPSRWTREVWGSGLAVLRPSTLTVDAELRGSPPRFRAIAMTTGGQAVGFKVLGFQSEDVPESALALAEMARP